MWDRVMAQYRIEDAGGIEMLTIACQAIDRSESCREEIDRVGHMIKTSTGMRSHPLIRDELQCRALAMRMIDKLGINHEALKSVGRPPGSIGWTPRED